MRVWPFVAMVASVFASAAGAGEYPSRPIRMIVPFSPGSATDLLARILKLPDLHERISREGTTPRTSTPEAFTKMVHEEIATRKKVFKAAGTKPD